MFIHYDNHKVALLVSVEIGVADGSLFISNWKIKFSTPKFIIPRQCK